MLALRTYQADCWTVRTTTTPTGKIAPDHVFYEGSTLVAAKPDKMRYRLRARGHGSVTDVATVAKRFLQAPQQSGKPSSKEKPLPEIALNDQVIYVSSGETIWRQFAGVCRIDTAHTGPEELGTLLEPWGGFYTRTASPYSTLQRHLLAHAEQPEQMPGTATTVLEVKSGGRKMVGGVACNSVFIRTQTVIGMDTKEYQQTWYIGVRDSLVRHLTEADSLMM
ncbi:MAG: hypothetical protein EOO38_25845, partial [Cytophagaceae bacterium]